MHTLRWVERAKSVGFEVVLYSQDGVIPESDFRIISKKFFGLTSNSNPLLNLYSEVRGLKRAIRLEKPDLIHLHWMLSPTAFALSFLANVRIVATPWGSDLLMTNEKAHWGRKQKFIFKVSMRRLIKRVKFFTCDADHLKERLIEFGAPEENIRIVYFGTDSETFSPSNRSLEHRNRWNLESKDVAIYSNRHFYPVYDIPTLIRAFSEVYKFFDNAILILGGDGPELKNLQNLVHELGIEASVVFLGSMTHEDFRKTVASCDIYVSTSTSDGGLASSVAEAMASGLPVVITEFGENVKWLEMERSGLSFPVGNIAELSNCLITLIEDQALRQRMGAAGRSTVINNLDPLAQTKILEKIYTQIC